MSIQIKKIFHLFLFVLFISSTGCYIIHKDVNGTYINYKGSKTPLLLDGAKTYFINEKGEKIYLVSAKPLSIK
jgi:hypothetical protein